jgi:hypothetical protein
MIVSHASCLKGQSISNTNNLSDIINPSCHQRMVEITIKFKAKVVKTNSCTYTALSIYLAAIGVQHIYKEVCMSWINELFSQFISRVWTVVQGLWLFLLYTIVAYVMVGSLGALQLRDALEVEQKGATYDEVIRIKEDFDKKVSLLENQSFVKGNTLYEDYYANESERVLLLAKLLKITKEESILETYVQPLSDDEYFAFIDKVTEICKARAQSGPLCGEFSVFNQLGSKSSVLYAEAEKARIKQEENEVFGNSGRAKLRESTPFTELFSTVEFMHKWQFGSMLNQPRELLVLQLTMVMGMLGSLVAMTWSYIRRDKSMSARRTLFLPLVGAVSAFIIFVFFKAGQLTISSGSGTSSLSPFFLSFVGIISGLLSERAYARMEFVGTKFFASDNDNLRWGVRLREALDDSGIGMAQLASYLGVEEGTARNIVDETAPVTVIQQQLIAACLRREARELFTDVPPKGVVAVGVAHEDESAHLANKAAIKE